MWRKWGTPQNFFLAFTDELEKQIFTKKVLKWAKKKQNNFNICNVAFKKKINKHLKISLFYACVPKILMIWPTVQRCRVWQTEIGSFRLCFALLCSPKCQKSKFWKNGKIPKNYDRVMYSSWDTVCNRLMDGWADGQTDGKSDI